MYRTLACWLIYVYLFLFFNVVGSLFLDVMNWTVTVAFSGYIHYIKINLKLHVNHRISANVLYSVK